MQDLTGPRAGNPLSACGPIAIWSIVAGTALDTGCEHFTDRQWHSEIPILASEGMAPYALAAAQSLIRSEAVYAFLYEEAVASAQRTLSAVALARPLLKELMSRGVGLAVIKGPAVALACRGTTDRYFHDVDIIVKPTDFGRALTTLQARGLRPLTLAEPPWPGLAMATREGVNLHSGDGANIDVHHRLPPWVFSRCVTAEAIVKSCIAPIPELGSAPAASAQDCLVVAALHILNDLWKGRAALQSWRDAVVIGEGLGPAYVQSAFRVSNLDWLLTLMANALRPHFPDAAVVKASSGTLPSLATSARLRMLGWFGDGRFSRQRLAWAARLPLPRSLLFVAGSALPSKSYIQQRDKGYLTYWARCLHDVQRAIGGVDVRMVDDPRQETGSTRGTNLPALERWSSRNPSRGGNRPEAGRRPPGQVKRSSVACAPGTCRKIIKQ